MAHIRPPSPRTSSTLFPSFHPWPLDSLQPGSNLTNHIYDNSSKKLDPFVKRKFLLLQLKLSILLEQLAYILIAEIDLRNILGAIGLSSQYKPTPRGRFLALAMSYYLRSQLVEGPTLRTTECLQQDETG